MEIKYLLTHFCLYYVMGVLVLYMYIKALLVSSVSREGRVSHINNKKPDLRLERFREDKCD